MTEPLDVLFEDAALPGGRQARRAADAGPPAGASRPWKAAVRRHLAPDDPVGVYLGTVHRLDRPVSGVVSGPRPRRPRGGWPSSSPARDGRKEYWAVVEETPVTPDRGVWDDWLCAATTRASGVVQVCLPGTPRARRAVDAVRASAGRGDCPTGRAWLRALARDGPDAPAPRPGRARGAADRGRCGLRVARGLPRGIALHARALTVQHPIPDEPMTGRGAAAGRLGRGRRSSCRTMSGSMRAVADQSTLISTIRSLSVPVGIGTSTTSPIFLPTRPWPIGLVRRILFWS